MQQSFTCQGRKVDSISLDLIKKLISSNPKWSRHKLSKEICICWNWTSSSGQLKTFAARSFLDKLELMKLINLPAICLYNRRKNSPLIFSKIKRPDTIEKINCSLKDLFPLKVCIVKSSTDDEGYFHYYLKNYHYLGFNRSVGEKVKYLIKDCYDRHLACLLFGAAAWKTACRDNHIGWDKLIREKRLFYIANNSRFLIMPFVIVKNLASHILGLISRRINEDWQKKYCHDIYLLESFIEKGRFQGSCYKAANWINIGSTKGRTRQDSENKIKAPIKDLYLYPLVKNYKEKLSV